MRALLLTAGFAGLIAAGAAPAVEGMWQPRQIPEIAQRVRDMGLALPPESISTLSQYPANAIVSLGGCTASFVSPQGLVVTNHHCAYGAIQYNSTGERNLIERGFLAADGKDELPADPAARIYVTEEIRDVTATIDAALAKAPPGRATYDALIATRGRLIRECEADGEHRCDVVMFHGGAEYNLVRQLEIRDVRLVYAPPAAIGKFGGDVDNWMWPRHTGDFAYLRAYVSKRGKPVAFHRDNVPYAPKSWLKVNPAGLAEGDFTMLLGYPGSTGRWRLASELDQAIGWTFPTGIAVYGELIATIEAATKDRPDAAVKYAASLAGLNNTLKNLQGQLAGFARAGSATRKRAQEQAMIASLRADPAQREAVAAYDALEALLAKQRANADADLRFSMIVRNQSDRSSGVNRDGGVINAAIDLYRTAVEREKPDAQREPGFQDRDLARIRARLEAFPKRFDLATDRALLDYRIRRYAQLPAAKRVPAFDAWLGISGDAPDLAALPAKLDAFYANTRLTDDATRLGWLTKSRAAIEASDDSALQLAVAMYPVITRIENDWKDDAGRELVLRPQYMKALIAHRKSQGLATYPDANGTLRFTFGTVQGYAPRDAVQYAPFTTLAGIAQKTTDTTPFNTPAAAREAIAAKRFGRYGVDTLGSVPVNFLSDLDITGGNSGSPTLDRDGKLVGLAFDGNWESVASNWVYDGEVSRTINVDVRYMLWVMDEVDHAERLIREMGLTPAD